MNKPRTSLDWVWSPEDRRFVLPPHLRLPEAERAQAVGLLAADIDWAATGGDA